MTPPADRYRAAIRTYLTRPGFWVVGGLIALDWLVLIMLGLVDRRSPIDANLPGILEAVVELAIICVFLGPYVLLVVFVALTMQHLRQQLFHSRAAVIPGFIRAHLTVAYTVLVAVPLIGALAFFAAFYLLLAPHEVFLMQIFGPLALLLFALAITIWMGSFRSPWIALLVLPLALLAFASVAMGPQSVRHVFQVLVNEDPAVKTWELLLPFAVLVGDALFLRLLFARLAALSGLDPEDTPRLFPSRPNRRPRPSPSTPIHLRPHRTLVSPLIRAWHRRSGIISPLAPWVVAISLGSLLLIVTAIFGGESSDLLRSVLLPTLVPGVVISLIWRERWMNLGYESLYPADRAQFLQELLGATAISLAELWLATAVAVIPPIVIHSPYLLISPMFLVTLIASAAMQFLVFGIMFLSALFRPMLPYVNVITILAQIIPITFAWADKPGLSQRGLLTVAGFEMLIGILITTYGYRNWRRADLA